MSDEQIKFSLRWTWWLLPLLALGAIALSASIRAVLSDPSYADQREEIAAQEARIRNIARQAVVDKEGWDGDFIGVIPIRNEDGSWTAWVAYRKGHAEHPERDLQISKDGAVISYRIRHY